MKKQTVLATVSACLLAVLLAACGDDPTEPDPGYTLATGAVTADDFLRNRFFSLYDGAGLAGFAPFELRVDAASIRVFRALPPGVFRQEDVAWIAAYVDSTGWGPGDPAGAAPFHHAWRWRPVPFTLRLDAAGRLRALDLGQAALADTDCLAVCYRIVDDRGDLIAQVGDDPAFGGGPSHAVPGDPENLYYALKLLKAPAAAREPWSFAYELRNVYSLGGANLDPEGTGLRIESLTDAATPERDETGLPYLQIFGLDLEAADGGPPDGAADLHRQDIFDLEHGLLWFPADFRRPFAPADPRASYETYARHAAPDWTYDPASYLALNQSPRLYAITTDPADLPTHARFRFVITTKIPSDP